ncbi:bifunctional WXG100 family type VII secretion target/C40 family peptidase [Nocardia stercoris]|uniref:DUF4226 domain-containing protein n=1 Tax=Nocardia stercoris TaxID=2483361 RepID=A0A3M2L2Y2_9NOCA|nr:NlpC/P60 family protein [Nocardia stercoris]RMI31744.1 DUF4226 domain-containing protein [Nocardia stercoris]
MTAPVVDLSGLAQPIVALLESFGSGLLGGDGPADALRGVSGVLDGIQQAGSTAVTQLSDAWSGGAGDAAMDQAMKVQNSAANLSDRGNDIADVVTQAAATVQTGQQKLDAVLQSFVSSVTDLGPAALTPPGIAAVVSSAIDHFGQALQIVGETRADLDTHTAAMSQLIPAPSTPSVSGSLPDVSSLAGTANSGLQQAGSLIGELIQAAESALNPSTTTGSTPSTTTQAPTGTQTGSHGGVMVTLPDGTQVEAPNQQAATAVQTALKCVGTPYVWGGNTPGSGLDCSGLTHYAYEQAGVELPRLAADQSQGAMRVSAGDVMPGDLAIWDGHVAMVVGNGEMVEAGNPVQVSAIRTENSGMGFHGFYRPTT